MNPGHMLCGIIVGIIFDRILMYELLKGYDSGHLVRVNDMHMSFENASSGPVSLQPFGEDISVNDMTGVTPELPTPWGPKFEIIDSRSGNIIHGNGNLLSTELSLGISPIHCPSRGHGYREVPATLFEGVLFNDELDMLEAHISESYSAVERFVVVESPYTFQGGVKALHFEENKARFLPFKDKIVHVIFPFSPTNEFLHEADIRNTFLSTVRALNASENSLLITSDTDEIIKLESLFLLRFCEVPDGGRFELKFFYYSLHWTSVRAWNHVFWKRLSAFSSITQNNVRGDMNQLNFIIPNAGWHCSYFGDELFIINKLHSFAPGVDAYKGPPYDTPEHIRSVIAEGKDLFLRPDQLWNYVEPSSLDGPFVFYMNPRLRKVFLLWGSK
jgi:beta-1,4-mannosyl-glycoprotein beta-1,4-N-acetylglucosaminyltransferase